MSPPQQPILLYKKSHFYCQQHCWMKFLHNTTFLSHAEFKAGKLSPMHEGFALKTSDLFLSRKGR